MIVLALSTSELNNIQSALLYAHEAISTLTRVFLRTQRVHAPLMEVMLRDYLWLCERAEQEPDRALLDPILPYFANAE